MYLAGVIDVLNFSSMAVKPRRHLSDDIVLVDKTWWQ
jgi:hypothetical protein